MKKRFRPHSSPSSNSHFEYQTLEPRQLLACNPIGNIGAGIVVADDATGPGYLLFSEQDVQTRFSLPTNNADHFVAVRLDGTQWQYNDNVEWNDFEPVATDRLMTEVDFTGDSVTNSVSHSIINGILAASRNGRPLLGEVVESDVWFNANRYNGVPNDGEFEVLGTCFDKMAELSVPNDIASKQEQILIGLLAYESVHGNFPSLASFDENGQPLLSWRVEILPLLGYSNLYNQFNHHERWDSPHNLSLIVEMPDIFASPNIPATGLTPFQAVGGNGTLFRPSGEPVGLRDIGDGASNTIAFVEANSDRAVIWTQPADLRINSFHPFDGVGENGTETFHAVTVPGQVLKIAPGSDPTGFINLLRIDDGNLVDISEFDSEPTFDAEEGLRDVGLALHNYESANQRLPAHAIYDSTGTTPLLSWRVSILPYLGEQVLFDQFHLDEPWDSAHNLALLPFMPNIFASPDTPDGFTNLLATTGDGTIFELENNAQSLNAIVDGFSNTTLAVRADIDQAVEWTRPEDWVFDPADPTDGLSGLPPEAVSRHEIRRAGFYTVYADASVRYLPADISDSNFTAMVMRGDGGVVDFDDAPLQLGPEQTLRQLGLAALNFESSFGEFPRHAIYSPDGNQALLSWRVQLLPFLDQQNLYDQFNLDEPWDSPNNLSLLDKVPDIFKSNGVADGMTNFLALVGEDTAFPTFAATGLGSITDPLMETILFVQANSDEAVEWTRPADISYDPENPRNGIGDATGSGFFVAMANGSMAFVNDSISDETVASLAQRNDGNLIEDSFSNVPNNLELIAYSSNNLRQVALASHNYASAFQTFPNHAIYSEPTSDGVPLLSWRVAILPFIEYDHLYDQFNLDEPWDSPHNLLLLPLMPDLFSNPSVPNHMTLIQAITTPRSVDNGGTPQSVFPIHYEDSVSYADITDGASNTLLFVEANKEFAVEWTRPHDLFYDDAIPGGDAAAGFGEAFLGFGSSVAFADASVRFMFECNLRPENARLLVLANDGEAIPEHECPTGSVPPFQFLNGRGRPDGGFGGFGGFSPILDSKDDGRFGERYTGSPATDRNNTTSISYNKNDIQIYSSNVADDRQIVALDHDIEFDPLESLREFDNVLDDIELEFIDADSSFLTKHLSGQFKTDIQFIEKF